MNRFSQLGWIIGCLANDCLLLFYGDLVFKKSIAIYEKKEMNSNGKMRTVEQEECDEDRKLKLEVVDLEKTRRFESEMLNRCRLYHLL